jgi:arginine exporter protein ArgO
VLSRALVAGLLAGYGAAVPIGAIAVLLVGLAARSTPRVAASAALAVATVDGGYALGTVLGGNALAAAIRHVATPLHWVAAAVLVVIAVHIAVSALRRTERMALPVDTPGRAYLTLIGLTAVNPTTVVYFVALAVGQLATGVLADAAFVLAVFVSSASWQLLLACGGRLLGRFLDTPRGRLVTALVASVLIIMLAVKNVGAW